MFRRASFNQRSFITWPLTHALFLRVRVLLSAFALLLVLFRSVATCLHPSGFLVASIFLLVLFIAYRSRICQMKTWPLLSFHIVMDQSANILGVPARARNEDRLWHVISPARRHLSGRWNVEALAACNARTPFKSILVRTSLWNQVSQKVPLHTDLKRRDFLVSSFWLRCVMLCCVLFLSSTSVIATRGAHCPDNQGNQSNIQGHA